MKLIVSLLTITATGIAAWVFLRKTPARAKLHLPKPRRTKSLRRKAHPLHHKRNGMKTHAAH